MIDGANTVCSSADSDDRPLGDRLGPHQPGAAARRGAQRGEEHEPLHAGALGRLDQPPGGDAGQLLDRAVGLVADHRGQVDDGVDAAQRVAERQVVAEIAERDLDPDALGPQPPRIADQAANRRAGGDQAAQQGAADGSGGAGEQQHRRERSRPGRRVIR